MEYLKNVSLRIHHSKNCDSKNGHKNQGFNVKTASVFPFSKEIQAFKRFENMLSFEIKNFYDVKYSGRVGAKLNRFIDCLGCDEIIKDIADADFSNIDTIVLGHMDELNSLLGYDLRKDILLKAINANVNVFSFDDISSYSSLFDKKQARYYYPSIGINDAPQNTFGKLYLINKPIVGIYGTSSSQGKFSLQLTLKKIFEENDYRVGTIGTEPHSVLFNMDNVYPMGYNSGVLLDYWDSVSYLNKVLYELCLTDKEIIIVSSQANSVPNNFYNLVDIPLKQQAFTMGIQPDAVILCVNIFDDIGYIRNSIRALEGIANSRVIALVLYPMEYTGNAKGIYHKKIRASKEKLLATSTSFHKEFNIPVFILGEYLEMTDLCDCIVNFF